MRGDGSHGFPLGWPNARGASVLGESAFQSRYPPSRINMIGMSGQGREKRSHTPPARMTSRTATPNVSILRDPGCQNRSANTEQKPGPRQSHQHDDADPDEEQGPDTGIDLTKAHVPVRGDLGQCER